MKKNWIYFIGGVVVGIILTIVTLYFIGTSTQQQQEQEEDPVQYLEKPVSYENKKETSFKVLQVLSSNAALAKEASDKIGSDVMYLGNTVLILGANYYSDQIVTVKNPQRVGTYSYTTNGGMPMTVPVIDGEME